MLCNRHHAIATNAEHGIGFCSRCFIEALKFADAVEYERTIQRIRQRLKQGLR